MKKITKKLLATGSLSLFMMITGCGEQSDNPSANLSQYEQNKIKARDLQKQIRAQKCSQPEIIFKAIENQDKAALSEVDANCYLKDANLLSAALFLGKEEMVDYLFDKVDQQKTLLPTMLVAASLRDLEMIKRLEESGASLDTQDFHEAGLAYYALCKVIRKSRNTNPVPMLNYLQSQGANINGADDRGVTPLHCAKDANTVDLLIAHGAKVNAQSDSKWTPLHRTSRVEVARALLKHGADINLKNDNGRTPLWLAANANDSDLVSLLIKHGADVNIKDNEGRTPLESITNSDVYSEEYTKDVVKLLTDATTNSRS